MDQSLSLFRRVVRNVRWYFEDVLTGITGRGKLHFSYGPEELEQDVDFSPHVNSATGLPMADQAVDVGGNPYGTRSHRW